MLQELCQTILTPPDDVYRSLSSLSSQVDISGCGDGSKRSEIEREFSVAFPFPSDLDKLGETGRSCNVQFVPPVKTLVIGAYSIGAGIRLTIKSFLHHIQPEKFTHSAQLDILVVIPRSFFSKHDYLDYRYTRKRAFYLAAITSILKRNCSLAPLISNLRYSFHRGNPLHPILLFDLRDSILREKSNVPLETRSLNSTSFTVCVHLGTEAGLFAESRLSNDMCNLRRTARGSGDICSWGSCLTSGDASASHSASQSKRAKFECEEPAEAAAAAGGTWHEHSGERGDRQQSPLYNASLLADMERLEQHARLVRAVDLYPHLRPALALLQLWLDSSARPTRVPLPKVLKVLTPLLFYS